MTVFAGIAEFEQDLIRGNELGPVARQPKRRGVRFGWPRELNPDQVRVAPQLLEESKAVRDIARTLKAHEATIYRLRWPRPACF
jgi:DNA invertase Pin-like site-specific DNA recombinase